MAWILKWIMEAFSELHLSRAPEKQTKASVPEIVPLKSIEQLLQWIPGNDEFCIARITKRSITKPGNTPRTLVCHDMKGGYLEDRFPQGSNVIPPYNINGWNQIDSFCYFSHNFITIPPPCWTNLGHRHGVKVLGTFITEWDDGALICKQIFGDITQVTMVVEKLVEITCYYQFDGWLINIESKIMPQQVKNVMKFLAMLTEALHYRIPGSEVIWYDSIIDTGQLKWQNKLCEKNRMFFDVCDGIFLNYNWSLDDLQESVSVSGKERQYDVYVGVDVFGRGCYGGGGWNTYKALKVIREKNLSAAIFAPGWVMETFGEEKFLQNNEKFWNLLLPYLYTHRLNSFPIQSSFSEGFGNNFFIDGKVEKNCVWANLSCQPLETTFRKSFYQSGMKDCFIIESCGHTRDNSFNGGGCYKIFGKVKPCSEGGAIVFRLFQTDVKLTNSQEYQVEYTIQQINNRVNVFLLLQFKDVPKFLLFGPESKTAGKPMALELEKEQQFNYQFHEHPLNVMNTSGWETKKYQFSVGKDEHLEEIQLLCSVSPDKGESDIEEEFQVLLGNIYVDLMKEHIITSACNFRFRNVSINPEGPYQILSFILSWESTPTSENKPNCYDIFVRLNGDSKTSKTTDFVVSFNLLERYEVKHEDIFVGRAFADAFCFTNIYVPSTHEEGICVTVVSIMSGNIRQNFSDAPTVNLTWSKF